MIYFARYYEGTIWKISYSKFFGVLPALTSTGAIGNLSRIFLCVNVLSLFPQTDILNGVSDEDYAVSSSNFLLTWTRAVPFVNSTHLIFFPFFFLSSC